MGADDRPCIPSTSILVETVPYNLPVHDDAQEIRYAVHVSKET